MPMPPEPSDSGWFSGNALLPPSVVMTGASSSSASSRSCLPRLGVMHALAGEDHRALGRDQRRGDLRDRLRVGAAFSCGVLW